MVELFENIGNPDQMPHSDMGLHCLPVSTGLGISNLSGLE